VVGGAALLVAVAAILGFGYWRENVARAQETAAVVFDERITTGELLELVRPRLAAFDRRIAAMRAAGMSQQATQAQLQRSQLPESVLNDLVEDRVIRREAARLGLSVSTEEIDARLRRLVAEANLADQPQPTPTPAPSLPPDTTPTAVPTPAGTPTRAPTATAVPTLTEDRYGPALQEYLSEISFSEEQVRRLIESELYDEKLREAMGEAEVPAIQEQVHVRHIVFNSLPEARQGLEQLQSGVAFEALAASASKDQATKDNGGDLGWLPRLGRDQAFDAAAFSLAPGQPPSEAVQTASGWELIEVLERDPARPVPPNQLEEMRRRHFGDWLAARMGDPEIDRDLSPEESSWILQRLAARSG
jgi:parvulin-like peptidyl-prolyl isomerase